MSALNKSQLYASFPDNNIGQIVPLNMRNFVDSVELKYDNYTVVKAGQPVGNSFPAPSAGKITLPTGTVWVINGSVTVNYPIFIEEGAVLIALTQALNVDILTLDSSAGAVALINSEAASFFLSGLTLDSGSGSGRLFDIVDLNLAFFDRCVFLSKNTGSISFSGGNGVLAINNSVNYVSDAPLQIIGDGNRLFIDNFQSGLNHTQEQIDMTLATFNGVSITNCLNESLFPMFSVVEGSASSGVIANNIAISGSPFVSGISTTSVNWTFSGNSGFANTVPVGALAVRGNATPTVITASGTFYPVEGGSLVADSVVRFESPSDSALKYIGVSAFKGVATVSVSLNNTHLTLPYDYTVSLFKNGVILDDGGVSYAASAIVGARSKQTLSFSAPISAALDDVFEVVLSSTTGTQSPIVEDLTFSIS